MTGVRHSNRMAAIAGLLLLLLVQEAGSLRTTGLITRPGYAARLFPLKLSSVSTPDIAPETPASDDTPDLDVAVAGNATAAAKSKSAKRIPRSRDPRDWFPYKFRDNLGSYDVPFIDEPQW
jgi:hypothetical protein